MFSTSDPSVLNQVWVYEITGSGVGLYRTTSFFFEGAEMILLSPLVHYPIGL